MGTDCALQLCTDLPTWHCVFDRRSDENSGLLHCAVDLAVGACGSVRSPDRISHKLGFIQLSHLATRRSIHSKSIGRPGGR
jgi:hypothetical protein